MLWFVDVLARKRLVSPKALGSDLRASKSVSLINFKKINITTNGSRMSPLFEMILCLVC